MRKWIFASLSIFISIVLIFMILMHISFSRTYYYNRIAEKVIESCESLEEDMLSRKSNENKYKILFKNLRDSIIKYGFFPIVLSEEGEILVSFDIYRNMSILPTADKTEINIFDSMIDKSSNSMVESFKGTIVKWMNKQSEPTYVVQEIPEIEKKILIIVYPFSTGEKLGLIVVPDLIEQIFTIANTFVVAVGSIALIITSIIAWLIANKLNRSLILLTKKAEQMGEMKFDHLDEIHGPQEIQILAKTLNKMSDKLKNTIDKLNDANDELEKRLDYKIKQQKIQKQFTSDVSHELKTPIAIIQSHSEALLDDIGDPKFYKESIYDEAVKMKAMVDQLLEYSKLESNELELRIDEINIVEIIDEQVKKFIELAEQNKNKINYIHKTNNEKIYGDKFRMEQVIKNLLQNAIRYSHSNSDINISVTEEEAYLKISFFNQCNYISAEKLEHIWDRFYKIDESRNRERGGSGLGLAIVKDIIEKHEGRYKAFYKGNGIYFIIKLKMNN